MSTINFITGVNQRIQHACKLVSDNYKDSKSMLIYSTNETVLSDFSQGLWSIQNDSFIPHESWANLKSNNEQQIPYKIVLISNDPTQALPYFAQHFEQKPILLNLDDSIAPNFEQFDLILEIIPKDEQEAEPGRNRWRDYKKLGYVAKIIKLNEKLKKN